MYIYTNLLTLRPNCGSAEQPQPSPIGKALNHIKPQPSDRMCEGIMRLQWQSDKIGSKQTPDWKTLEAAKALTSWALT